MPTEFLRLLKPVTKVWLKPLEKYRISISYQTGTEITPRTIEVAEAFGLGIDQEQQFIIYDDVELDIGKKDIVYITGESGSGKSAFLKFLANELKDEAINIADAHPDLQKPLIDALGKTTEEGLELLAKVGLGDAFLFVRRFSQLSDGQRYRFLIAKLIESQKQFWIMDEFCATLDRDTAKIVAFNVQKLSRQQGRSVLAATTHMDLLEDLNPSVYIDKRFGKEIKVSYHKTHLQKQCSILKQIRIRKGTLADYKVLASFHYRSHHIGALRKVFCARRNEEVCGAIVYTYPAMAVSGRRKVLPRMRVRELNEKLSNIMRVVVHPKYRTIGLGQKLVSQTLRKCGTPYVETTAVMAKYNPFFEKAGMTKIQDTPPTKQAEAISRLLQSLNFDITFLSSEKYTLSRMKTLKDTQLSQIRQAFINNNHVRFMKEFFYHQPYGKKDIYQQCVATASLEKLAKLIHVTAMLLQTKIYLFWSMNDRIYFKL